MLLSVSPLDGGGCLDVHGGAVGGDWVLCATELTAASQVRCGGDGA